MISPSDEISVLMSSWAEVERRRRIPVMR